MTPKEIKDNAERMCAEAFHNGKDLTLLVEGEGDITFWATIFNAILPNLTLDFPFTSSKGTKGADEITKYKSEVSKQFVICRDSDNRYLYKENERLQIPYFYHTHTYNRENHLCYAKNLNQICFQCTNQKFDFQGFIDKYSEITFPILLHWLYFFQDNIKEGKELLSASNDTLRKCLSIAEEINSISTMEDIDICLYLLKEKVSLKLATINEQLNWLAFVDFQAIEANLKQFDIVNKNTIFFLNGHIIYKDVILPLMKKVVSLLKMARKKEIQDSLTKANEQIKKEKSKEYDNLFDMSVETLLAISYEKCFINLNHFVYMKKISNDIESHFTN